MPAMLDPDDYERWLDPGITKPEMILDCLRPFRCQPDEEISGQPSRESPRKRR